jgi:VIT1/CCC1 family predicted Fe2+/Mn2+ transporter
MSDTRPPISKTGRIGLIIVGISLLFWVFLPVIPFLPLKAGQKGILATVTFVLAEVLFYLGVFMAGKSVIQRYQKQLDPRRLWRKQPANAAPPTADSKENV